MKLLQYYELTFILTMNITVQYIIKLRLDIIYLKKKID